MIKFTDFPFFLFLSLLIPIYYKTPASKRWIVLLVASIIFNISWSGMFTSVWVFMVLLCFFSGKYLGDSQRSKKSKTWVLTFSILLALVPLLNFKYIFPNNEPADSIMSNWLAPIGLSYYTFLIIGYLTDVKRRYIKPEKHLGYLALYLGLFPTLLAGPIERARNLIPQLRNPKDYDFNNLKAGAIFILWGLFKKIVLAARLSDHTAPVFQAPDIYNGWSICLAIALFSIQLYCDFSGYCDIATGSARLFGIRLSKNFANRYYFTPTRTESWNGWNITVTNWFRDYVFFSISKGVTNVKRLEFNRLLTFVVTGMWHGASFSFVIWGFLQWAYVTFETRTQRFWQKSYATVGLVPNTSTYIVIQILIKQLTGTMIMGWFRAESLESGLTLYANMFGFGKGENTIYKSSFLLTLGLFLVMDFFNRKMGESEDIASFILKASWEKRYAYLFVLLILLQSFGQIQISDFYYIRF